MKATLPIVLLFVSFAVVSGQQHWWEKILPSFSSAPHLSKSQLYAEEFGVQNVRGYVAATGDFDSDKFTDLFIVTPSDGQFMLQVYKFVSSDFKFVPMDSATVTLRSIENVVPGDFNYDGNLDVLITGIGDDGSLFMDLYRGDHEQLKLQTKVADVTEAPLDQVLVMDANNDMRLDLFGTSAATGKRVFWMNYQDKSEDDGMAWVVQDAPTSPKAPLPIAVPNSNAVVDMNGDCLADLVVISQNVTSGIKTLEIWLNEGKDGFQFDESYELVKGAGQIAFSDFDADGTVDIAFPVCDPPTTCTSENSVHIIYNNQKKVCSGLWSTDCRSPSELCSNSEYSLPDMNTSKGDADVVILDSFLDGDSKDESGTLWSKDSLVPLTIRTGDYNLDGYEDLLIPILTESGQHVIQLWKNVACDDDTDCSEDAETADRRTFELVTKGVKDLSKITNAYTATFFDIGELGIFDIVVLTDESLRSGGSSQKGITTLFNNFFNDAYFVKMLESVTLKLLPLCFACFSGLNGICPSWCSNSDRKFPDPKPYGVNQPGGVFKFTVTDSAGKKRGAIGNQLTQSAYLSLQLPYAFLGLGRTSNYIDSMFYGITLNQSVNYNQWQGIIPNSQVAAFPYKLSRPTGWVMEMYISPSGILFWVIVMCAVVCLIFAFCIGFFTYRERQQDKKAEQEKGFSFNPL